MIPVLALRMSEADFPIATLWTPNKIVPFLRTIAPPRTICLSPMNSPADAPPTHRPDSGPRLAPTSLAWRCLLGGGLMGLANVVPGISGGAMLLIVGIYRKFIGSVAELSALKFRLPSLITVGSIGLAAMLTILLSADLIAHLVTAHPVETYSIFTGLRLGAIPIVYRLARPLDRSAWTGVLIGLLVTSALALLQYRPGGTGSGETSPLLGFTAGLVGASATLLPGMDGSYFLLLMGQYLPILTAIGRFRAALQAGDVSGMLTELEILAPTALGVGLGIAGVSLLLKWLFRVYPKSTLGVLLGIVGGAFIGLYPFREAVAPEIGDMVRGVQVTTENAAELRSPERSKDWPLRFYVPTLVQSLYSLALVGGGIVLAWLLSKLEPKDDPESRLGLTH